MPYPIYGTSCAAGTVPGFFMGVKIMRIKAQENTVNSSGIEFLIINRRNPEISES
jgi:hypothetical protein